MFARFPRLNTIWLLYAATIVSMISTVLIFSSENQKNAMLTTVTRTSGWIVYQASLETVKSQWLAQTYLASSNRQTLDALTFRLELLLSRLEVLLDSDEGRAIASARKEAESLQGFRKRLTRLTDNLESMDPMQARQVASDLPSDLEKMDVILQHVLTLSIAYNKDIFDQERKLSESFSYVPFLAGNLSGAMLLLVITRQSRRNRMQVKALVQAQRMQDHAHRNLIEMFSALPVGVKVLDAERGSILFENQLGPRGTTQLRPFLNDPQEKSGEEEDGTQACLKVNGEDRSYSIICCPILWDAMPARLVILMDITDVRQAEMKLLRSAKLAVLGEIASSIVHEINQPLATIKLAAENAQRTLPASEERLKRKLAKISVQVDRAKRITDQVLAMGRIDGGSGGVRFPLLAATDAAIRLVSRQFAERDIRIERHVSVDDGLHCPGEATMFEQVMMNLLVNSMHAFAEHRGRMEENCVTIDVALAEEPDKVKIEVSDNAGGIPETLLDTLFDPFVTTRQNGKGSGLGLALARRVVNQSGGSIVASNVKKEPGASRGACFTIVLPMSI